MKPELLRSARCFLDLSRNALAKATNLSPETIKNIEHGVFSPQIETQEKLEDYFLSQGVKFIRDGILRMPETIKKIFLVQGNSRSYNNRNIWSVCGFLDKEKAERLIGVLDSIVVETIKNFDEEWNETELGRRLLKLDRNAKPTRNGIYYKIIELEIRDVNYRSI